MYDLDTRVKGPIIQMTKVKFKPKTKVRKPPVIVKKGTYNQPHGLGYEFAKNGYKPYYSKNKEEGGLRPLDFNLAKCIELPLKSGPLKDEEGNYSIFGAILSSTFFKDLEDKIEFLEFEVNKVSCPAMANLRWNIGPLEVADIEKKEMVSIDLKDILMDTVKLLLSKNFITLVSEEDKVLARELGLVKSNVPDLGEDEDE